MSNPFYCLLLISLFNVQNLQAEDNGKITHHLYHHVNNWGLMFEASDARRGYIELQRICIEQYGGEIDVKSLKNGFISNRPIVIADCIEK